MSGVWGRALQAPAWARWAALGGILALIAVLGGQPQKDAPGAPEWFGFLSNLAHQPLYAALAVSAAVATRTRLPAGAPRILALLAFAGAVGVLDEWHQATVPNRDSSLWDLGSDLLGAAAGLWFAARCARPQGPWRPVLPLVLVVMLCLAWNCFPSFAPSLPMPRPA